MRLNRFIADIALKPGKILLNDKDLIRQLIKVLRVKRGDKIILGDGKGLEADAEILQTNSGAILVHVSGVRQNSNEFSCHAVLYSAVLKRENFEWVVQKATEIGVKEIVPVRTSRTVKTKIDRERLVKIAREAAEQSGRGIVPDIGDVISFDIAIKSADKNDVNLLFDADGKDSADELYFVKEKKRIGIFIGPEGGWEGNEFFAAKERGFKILNLGKLTFRAETAAVIASYLTLIKYGDTAR